MTRRDLKYKSIALSVDNSLELLDDCGMKFVKGITRIDPFNKFPEDNLGTSFCLELTALLDSLD